VPDRQATATTGNRPLAQFARVEDISARTIQYRLHEYGVAAARTKG
jgi:hypothetical protein